MLATIAEITSMKRMVIDEGDYFDKYKNPEEGFGTDKQGREFIRFKVRRLSRTPNLDQYEEKVEFWVTVFERYQNSDATIVASSSADEGCCCICSPELVEENIKPLMDLVVWRGPTTFISRNCGRVEIEVLERV